MKPNYRLESENAEAQAMSAQLREEVLRKKNELMKEQKQIDRLTKENESNVTQVQENEKRAKAAETKLSEIKAETKMVNYSKIMIEGKKIFES